MALINTSLPNLIQGVSQQPDVLRYDGQCEEQENALSSVVDGLVKRPNTRHVARLLEEAISSNAKIHFINRTEDERYVAIHDGSLRIFNLDTGVEATITDNTSGSGYLNVTTPRDDLEMVTVADYTFVVNKTTEVQASSTDTADYTGDAAVFIKQIGYFVLYTISTDLGGVSVRTGTSNSSNNTNTGWNNSTVTAHGSEALDVNRVINGSGYSNGTIYIYKGLKERLNDISGISATSIGGKSLIVSGHSSIEVSDSSGNEAIGLVYKNVDDISNLPIFCKKDMVVKVSGDPELDQDDYYVKFVTNDGGANGRGYWEETVSPNVSIGIDNATAPHQLVNTGTNQFTLQRTAFDERNAGDNDTNPHPSFIGKKINSIFFFKNRLGFVTNDSVVMSEAGHFFNFYRKTVTTLLDDEPIDMSVASTKVTNLNSAVGFQGNLLLFADNQQFVLKGGDVLTAKTVSINSATSFEADSAVKPLALGSYVYFPFSRGAFTGVREFAVDASTDNFNAVEITDHVPSYIPKNIIDISGTASEDMLVFLSGDEKNSLYVYNYFWNNTQKVLSAWSKFTFEGEVRGVKFIGSTLYIVLAHNNETQLLELPLESGLKDDVGYTTYLDQRVETTVLAGDDTITLPYTPASEDTIEVYTKDGLKLSSSRTGSTVTLTQAVAEDTDVWLGYPFTMKYTFSELLFKAAAGNSKSPSNAAKLKVRNGSLFYNDSAYFKVSVTPLYRDTYENVFTPDVVGSTTLGELNLDSGAYRFPVFSNAEDTKITITNDSALPSNITSAEFESFVHSRSNRYAG